MPAPRALRRVDEVTGTIRTHERIAGIARVLRPAGLLWRSVKHGRGDWCAARSP